MSASRPFPAWPDVAAELIAVAARRAPADLVIRDCAWVNVHSREVIEGSDVAIRAGRFAACGPEARPLVGPETRVIDAGGRYLIPGLCDGHMHVELGHADRHRVRPRGDAARHHLDVRRPARGRERARPLRRAADARRGGGAADQRLRADAGLRPLGAGAGDDRGRARAGRCRRGDGLAADHRPRRDDELPRRRARRREDARRDRRDAAGGEGGRRPLREPGPHRLSRPTSPAAPPTTTRARASPTRSRGCGTGCGRCCASGRPGTT